MRTPPKKLGDATMLPSKAFLSLTKREGIHVPKMKKDFVYDVHSDMMTMPPYGLKEHRFQILEYPFRKTKTSDFLDKKSQNLQLS